MMMEPLNSTGPRMEVVAENGLASGPEGETEILELDIPHPEFISVIRLVNSVFGPESKCVPRSHVQECRGNDWQM